MKSKTRPSTSKSNKTLPKGFGDRVGHKNHTNSDLKLSQRRERAFELFARGYTVTDVSKDLKVAYATARSYRKKYEKSIHAQAAANPQFLKDVVTNTVRALEELDQIRADAWKHMEKRKQTYRYQCPECSHKWKDTELVEVPDATRTKYQNVLLKAQEQRAKMFGVLGVKQEVFISIMQVKIVQDKILEFLSDSLCEFDRNKLADFLSTPELSAYMNGAAGALDAGPIIDAEVVES